MSPNKFFLSASVAAIASVVVANPADALTFDFAGSGSLEPTKTFTEGGVSVDVSTNADFRIGQNSNGLYVRNDSRIDLPSDQVDGFGNGLDNEFLEFDFGSTLVNSVSVTFGKVGSNDDFSFFLDDTQLLFSEDIPGGGSNFFDNQTGTYFFSSVPAGSKLKFLAEGANDDWTIKSLTVEAVPTPAAVLPVISGLFAAAGRRKDEETEEA